MDEEKSTQDWIHIEKWLVVNSHTEPLRWFTSKDIAEDLNMNADDVESTLESHFEAHSIERRTKDKGFEYRNFQYDYSVKSNFSNAKIEIKVEAPRDELHAAVQRLIFGLRSQGWIWEDVHPHDYNDYDKQYSNAHLLFVRKYK